MVNTVETLEIQVKTTGVESLKDILKLVKEIGKKSSSMTANLEKFSNGIGNISSSAKEATKSANKLARSIGKITQNSGSLKASKGIKSIATSAKSATKQTNKLLRSLERIAFYRIIRTIVKAIGDAFREGLSNAYAFSSTINGTMAQALDSISSKSLQMKNALGSALGELLTNLAPILNAIASLITKVAYAMSQLFAALGGRSKWQKATDSVSKWGDAASGAAGSAKEWKNQLMGFDEINKFNDQSDSGGGGGADTGIGNWELEDVSEKIQQIADKLRGIWENSGIVDAWNRFKDSIINSPILDFIGRIAKAVLLIDFRNLLTILADGMNIISDILMLDWYNGINDIKDLVIDLIASGLSPTAAVIDEIFGTNIQGWIDSTAESLKSFDLAAWFVDAWETVKRTWGNVSTWFSTTVIQPLVNLGTDIYNFVVGIINNAWLVFQATCPMLTEGIRSTIGIIKACVSQLWDFIKTGLTTLVGIVSAVVSTIATLFVSGIKTAANIGITVIESVINFIIRGLNGLIQMINQTVGWAASITGGSAYFIKEISSVSFGRFAEGGFPDKGQLFIANEAGAEMVGSMNGRTAVANNDQIVEGIQQGVYNAMMSALSEQGQRESIVKVFLDSREIRTSQRNLTRAMGV